MSLPSPSPTTDVIVTGASSGIGTELARGLARRGHNLVLVARRKDRLDALAESVRADHGVEVTVRPCDLSDAADRAALIEELRASGRTIGGICNCAGFGTAGAFKDLPVARESEQIEVNVVAVMELTQAFLDDMIAEGAGAILNVASLAAFQPLPGLATYAATKAFVQSFSEAVHEELRDTGVSCTALCPGPVPTEWASVAGAQSWMLGPVTVSAEQVAEDGITGMAQGKRSVVPGVVPKAVATAGRFVPRTMLLPGITLSERFRRG